MAGRLNSQGLFHDMLMNAAKGQIRLADLSVEEIAQLKRTTGVKNLAEIDRMEQNADGATVVTFALGEIDGVGRYRESIVETSVQPPLAKLVWHWGVMAERDVDDFEDRGAPRGISEPNAVRIQKVLKAATTDFANIDSGIEVECLRSPLGKDQYDVMIYFVPSQKAAFVRDMMNRRWRSEFKTLV